MTKRRPHNPRQLLREKLLFRYSSALERGDFDALTDILRRAEDDPILEQMILDINDIYRAEVHSPAPSLTLSTNHNHRNMREYQSMSISTSVRRLSETQAERTKWHSVTLVAAVLAVVLFSSIFLAVRRPNDPQPDNLAALQGTNDTATPTPLPPTVVPIITATPIGSVSGGGGAEACMAYVPLTEGVDVLSLPMDNAVAIGHLPLRTPLIILDQQQEPVVWFFVRGVVDGVAVQGWVMGRSVASCADGSSNPDTAGGMPYDPEAPVLEPSATALPPCVTPPTPTFTPTPLGNPANSTAESIPFATATPIPYAGSEASGDPCLAITITPCVTAYFIPVTPTFTPSPYATLNPQTATAIAAEGSAPIETGTVSIDSIVVPHGVVPCVATGTPTPFDFVPAPAGATPTAGLDSALRSGGYEVITLEAVGSIPANTPVRIISAFYNGSEWFYDIATSGNITAQARESQLGFARFPNPTPSSSLFTLNGYSLVTTVVVGDIPAGMVVQITSGYFDGTQWVYSIVTEDGRSANATDAQLAIVPGQTATASPIPPVVLPSPTIPPFPT